ncbi:MAG: lysophospholipid transporter LplT [Betaproteobacteria bacterium]|jgi:MFS transporter, LPLT family, lysophospholipid transporter|nr:lysophospholipid transporter LplT [Betaproteobacteria bacterium]NDD00540.1 lysophospholipid transporter LplT [Betaproteobacteria bacterium]NDD24550.1 lysophospholipid transporter LplT [Betaproteobacteria bacterium]
MPKGFFYLIGAQFTSGLADNALLILGIAFLSEQGYPGWWAPLLKFSFTLSYVVLAPLMGPLADAFSKAKLMAFMNALKVVGVAFIFTSFHPMLAFAIVGVAASAYAPAKYGLITETVPESGLVKANGWLEVTVVMSVILGTACGGMLVATSELPWMSNFNLKFIETFSLDIHTVYAGPLLSLILIYSTAALLNFGIPNADVSYAQQSMRPIALIQNFMKSNYMLWSDSIGRISLAVTTLFWGIGAVVQFAVLLWAKEALNMPLEKASLLQAVVAFGVIFGAGVAGHSVALKNAYKVLPLGLWLGFSLPALAFATSLWIAIPLMLVTGFAGGMLMVPMNALLQNRGYHLLTAGRSIAVQGFNENASVMLMLGIYSGLLALEFPLQWVMTIMGSTMILGMLYLMRMASHKTPSTCSAI